MSESDRFSQIFIRFQFLGGRPLGYCPNRESDVRCIAKTLPFNLFGMETRESEVGNLHRAPSLNASIESLAEILPPILITTAGNLRDGLNNNEFIERPLRFDQEFQAALSEPICYNDLRNLLKNFDCRQSGERLSPLARISHDK